MGIIKLLLERPVGAKETPHTLSIEKIKFVRYIKVLAPPRQREKENYISYYGSSTKEVPSKANLLCCVRRRALASTI
jgi:hypothetical protein